jgi:uncharacterized membrane protein YfcA
MTISLLLLFALLGMFAGSLSGLLGIGGGVILVPALIFLFGLTPHLAQGTTLALMVPPIGLLAAVAYYRHGHVHLRIAAMIAVGFIAGGFFGAELAVGLSNSVLEKVFGSALLIIALKVLLTPGQPASDSTSQADNPHKHQLTIVSALLLVVLGLVVGSLSGLIGIGGGVLLVPALMFFFGLSQHEAQGTTLALMVPPVGLLGAWEFYRLGDVDLPIAAVICAGFFFGALGGAKLATRLPGLWLTRVFGVGMILIAAKMLLG